MKSAGIIALLVAIGCLFPLVRADQGDDKDKSIAELKQKVADLDKRVAALEQLMAPLQADAQKKVLREQFEQRMAQDEKKYKPDQLRDAESLYQTMNKQWNTDAGKQAMQTLVQKYPDINRTGCAYLYLGQVSQGDDREKYLQTAIDKYSDCMYGDGVQVGAYARFLLGMDLKAKGDKAGAGVLFEEMKKEYPYALDHHGDLLEDAVPKE